MSARAALWARLPHIATWAGVAITGMYAAIQGAHALLRHSEDLLPDQVPYEGTPTFVNGVEYHVIDQGTGPVVALIHGFGGSVFSFRKQIDLLAHTHRVIAIDLPGFGSAGRPEDIDLSLTAHAVRTWALLDRIGVSRLILVGHSMGGAIAARMAAALPERVERLVLVSATHPEQPGAPPLPGLLRPLMVILLALLAWQRPRLRWSLRQIVYDPAFVTDAVWEGYSRPWRIRGTGAALLRLMHDVRRDPPLDPACIAARTLLLWGEADPVEPLHVAHDLHRRIPDARLEVIAKAGHLPLEEQPAAATDAIMRFLGGRNQTDVSASAPTALPTTTASP